MNANEYLSTLVRGLLQAEDLGGVVGVALGTSRDFVGADYGLLVCVNEEREPVHIETMGLRWRRGDERAGSSGEPSYLAQKLPVRHWVKHCRVLAEGRGFFERQARIRSYVGSDGKDRLVFHRMFEERFATYMALPLLAETQVVGELTLGFASDTAVPGVKRRALAEAAPGIAAALRHANQESDTRALLPLMRELAHLPAAPQADLAGSLSSFLTRLLAFTGGEGVVLWGVAEPGLGQAPPPVQVLAGAGRYYEWARQAAPGSILDRALEPLSRRAAGGRGLLLDLKGSAGRPGAVRALGQRGAPAAYWESIESILLLPMGERGPAKLRLYLEFHLGEGADRSQRRLQALAGLAENLGVVLRLTRVNRLLIAEQAGHLSLLHDLSRKLLTEKHFSQYQHFIAEIVHHHLRAEVATIFLYDKKSCRLERVAWFPPHPELTEVVEAYEPAGRERGITGSILSYSDGQHLLLNDAHAIVAEAIPGHLDTYRFLPSWSHSADDAAPSPIRHLLVVPIVGENGKVFGALRAINKRSASYDPAAPDLEAAGFNEESDPQLLKTIAAILASKLSAERRAQHLEALNEVAGRIATAATSKDLAEVVVATIVERLGYSACSFRLLVEDQLTPFARRGFNTNVLDKVVIQRHQGLAGRAIAEGRTVTARDVLSRSREDNQGYESVSLARAEGLRGACCVPVRTDEGEVYGAIMTYTRHLPYEFFGYETHLLETIATAASVAFRKLTADARVQTAEGRLRRLISILELMLADDSKEEIVRSAFGEVVDLLEGDAGALFSNRTDEDDAEAAAGWIPIHVFNLDGIDLDVPREIVRATLAGGPHTFLCKQHRGLRPLFSRGFVHGMTFSLRGSEDALGGILIVNRADPERRIAAEERRILAGIVGRQLARTFKNLELAQERARLERAVPAIVSAVLAAGMVHEINNKAGIGLNKVKSILGSDAGQKLSVGLQGDLRDAEGSLYAIGGLARDYLNFNKPMRRAVDLQKRRSSINKVVRDALNSLREVIRKATYRADLDPDLEPSNTLLDRRFIRLAIENLLLNAIRWISAGGGVVIKTGHREHEAYIRVEDWGPGVDREDEETIFNPFFTKSLEGSGLGLTVSRFIVQDLHGGRLKLVQRRNPTIFEIAIPRET